VTAGAFIRTYPLDDITIRSGGDGRTVEAYAAVFDTEVEIQDHQGHYLERISSAAFERTIAHRGTKFGVFYNHGLTLHGTPSERGSMPIGTPVEVRADNRGLLTVTRYNQTELADEALEAIRTGAITGQSFSGRFIGYEPQAPRGGFKRSKTGELTVVTRNEIAMTEYGPTPFPAYEQAQILGVRSISEPGCDCNCGCDPDSSDSTRDGGPGSNVTPDTDPAASHLVRLHIQRNLIRGKLRERGLL